jgi:hypothetical protein
MARKKSALALGLAGILGLGIAGVANAAVTPTAPAASPSWQSVLPGKVNGTVSAVTAVTQAGKTYEYAFVTTAGESANSSQLTLYWRVGNGAWTKKNIVNKLNETVVAATALSPTDVLAFTGYANGGRVLRFNGKTWAVIKTFNAAIYDATVLADNDIWVYEDAVDGGYHYNGHTWTKVGNGLYGGGSATSATNAWAFNGTTVAHYNGKKWTTANLAKLLPAPTTFTHPGLVGVVTSNSTVYAIADGHSQDAGGPVYVLEYNGKNWAKVATGGLGNTGQQEISSDGHGGLWIAVGGGGAPGSLQHYSSSSHTITRVTLPGEAGKDTSGVESIVNIPGTTEELAGGWYLNTTGTPPQYAQIYFYN